MIHLLGLLLVPLLVGGAAFYVLRATITWKEFVAQEVVSVLLLVGGFQLAKWGALQSTEHWNGHITEKTEDSIGCCHCTTVCDSRDKQGNCTSSHTECDHVFDSEWNLHVSTGDVVTVETCDGWGSAPDEWTRAKVGEFAAVSHGYTNYLKADPDTLLRHGADEKMVGKIPSFPEIHDLYRVKKVVADGATAPRSWQGDLEKLNDEIGGKKQIDVTFLLTKQADADRYASAVEHAWLYGPKNALIVVMGTDGSEITWARVVTVSRVEELKIELRDGLPGRPLDDPKIVPFVRENVERLWHRTAMAEFEYLASHASPTTGGLVLLYILSLVLSVGLTVLAHREDVFGDEGWLNRRRRTRW